MKPNDDALDEALSVTQIPEENMREYMRRVLTAAYAAQFQSKDYAGLIEKLRKGHVRYAAETQDEAAIRRNKERAEAADALEALLAERDALKAELDKAQEIARVQAERIGGYIKTIEERDAERDSLLARLQAAADRLEKLAGDMRPPNSVTPQLFMLANSMKQNAQQAYRNARLAPVDDKALVEIAAKAIETQVPPQDVQMGDLWDAAITAIAAIRPHIEAVEREQCAKAVEKVAEKINVAHHERPDWEDGYLQGVHDAAAAIRSGK